MLRLKTCSAVAIIAGCALLSVPANSAHAREGLREIQRTKVLTPRASQRKHASVNADKRAKAEYEPFCVRPFEYPRKGR